MWFLFKGWTKYSRTHVSMSGDPWPWSDGRYTWLIIISYEFYLEFSMTMSKATLNPTSQRHPTFPFPLFAFSSWFFRTLTCFLPCGRIFNNIHHFITTYHFSLLLLCPFPLFLGLFLFTSWHNICLFTVSFFKVFGHCLAIFIILCFAIVFQVCLLFPLFFQFLPFLL